MGETNIACIAWYILLWKQALKVKGGLGRKKCKYVGKSCFTLSLSVTKAWHSDSTKAAAACTTKCLTLAKLTSFAIKKKCGEGGGLAKLSLREIKLKLIKAELTKGTRNISTVSHPTGWPRARNFHYNFSKRRRKGEKIFHKSIIKAPTRDALLYNQNLWEASLSGSQKPSMWKRQAFYIVGGVCKTTTVLHWSLRASQIIKGLGTTEKGGQSQGNKSKLPLGCTNAYLEQAFSVTILHIKQQGGLFKIKTGKRFILLQAMHFLFGLKVMCAIKNDSSGECWREVEAGLRQGWWWKKTV